MKKFQKLSLVSIGIFVLMMFTPLFASASAPIAVTPSVVVPACVTLDQGLWYGKYDVSTNGQVSVLQTFLHEKGYLSVTATGYFGPLTLRAVKVFQAVNGLNADGIVGVQTRAHIIAMNTGICYPATNEVPTISSLTPTAAVKGTVVTIVGTGFTSTNNIVHFSIGAISNLVATNNDTTLSFTVPSSIGPYCKPAQACPMYLALLNPGTYPVYVENANGTSNSSNFTITN